MRQGLKRTLTWGMRLALALGLAVVVVGLWNRDALMRLQAVNTLFAQDRIVANFSAMDQLFDTAPVPKGATPVTPLPQGADLSLPTGFDAWLTRRAVTGIVVLRNGDIVHEGYHLGTAQDDRRISWSVAKSYISALFGVLLDQGAIASLDDPVTRYAPSLIGSAYEGATLRQVLQMSSGVAFNEDYFDFWSDINKMGRVLALGGSMDAFAAGQDSRFQAPGTGFQYVSIDTHVLSMVVRGATGRSIPELLSEHIVQPMGLERAPYYVTDGYGVAFVLGGLNLTTRDYARMGQMFLNDGVYNGRQIVPADWVRASTAPSARTAPGRIQYGYQWWIPADAPQGEFLARGVYGQFIYINRATQTVIALNSADRAFRADGAFDDVLTMLR
ncbi:MAG: serine hydrolase domain-containing protein, partial [Primorskyibacter sp.]